MRVGTLEIQMMADMARLSKDMRQAQTVVSGAMTHIERSVAGAKRAMQALGVGLPIAMITDQVRRMTDQFTKLDAQLQLTTKSQEQYARGMSDIRRISAIAQSDISATSMLYTRLMNVTDGMNISQAKIATITETVSYGLKAYGATAQEAASAALQLSQAMGANRLGGEEFRAVMEAMPNVMKVLASSMGVPLGELRALSIAGKITADEMVKAFGDPKIAAEFKRLAENTQTITGAWVVARNELMLLIGEFMKSSGATGGMISAFNNASAAIRFLADNMGVLLNALYAYITVVGGKLIIGLTQARMAQMALNAAHGEAIAVNAAMAKTEAANALLARDTMTARAFQLRGTLALNVAHAEAAAINANLAKTELENAAAARASAVTRAAAMMDTSMLVSAEARLAAATRSVVNAEEAAAFAARNVAVARAAATTATTAQTAANARLEASTAAVAAAEKLQAAGSISIASRVTNAVGKAGWIGLALFGVWAVVDFLNGMQAISDGAKKLNEDLSKLAGQQLQLERANLIQDIKSMETSIFGKKFAEDRYRVELRYARERLAVLDAELDRRFEVNAAEFAARKNTEKNIALTHDQVVILERYDSLLKQYNDHKLTQIEFEAKVHDVYGVGAKAAKAAAKELAALKKEESETMKAAARELASIAELSEKVIENSEREIDALKKKIEQERYELSIIGKTKEEIALLESVRYDNVTAMMEETIALNMLFDNESQEIVLLKEQVRLRKELKGAMIDQSTVHARQKIIDDERKAHEKMWESINNAAHDTFMAILRDGKSAAEQLKDAFKRGFFEWLYSMTVKKWVINVSTVAGGGGSAAAMAGDMIGGGGGGSSWLSAGYSLFKTMKLGFDGVAAGFTELAGTISGSLQSMGVAAETAGTIGVAGAYIGAGMAGIQLGAAIAGDKKFAGMSGNTTATIGAVIGSIVGGPIGGLIGGAIGGAVNAAFGRGPKVSGTTTMAGTFSEQGFAGNYQTPWSQKGGWFSSGRSGVDISPIAQAQSDALKAVVVGGKSVFDNLVAASGDAEKSLAGWTFAINRQVANQDQQKQLITDISNSMGDFLIPALRQFMREGENLADTAVRMRDTFVVTDAILGLVGQTFDKVGLASMGMRSNLTDLLGGVQKATTSMDAYYKAFFSDNERAIDGWKQMTATLRGIGISTVPTTNAAFRSLVEAQDLNTEAGQSAFAVLISMATTFDQLTKSTAALNTNLQELEMSGFRTLVDYTRAVQLQKNAASAGSVLSAAGVPGFASGGEHSGGWRIVGENGPELEYTGPSTIRNASDTRAMLDTGDASASMSALREELRAMVYAIAAPIQKSYKILDRWDGEGMPEVRESA